MPEHILYSLLGAFVGLWVYYLITEPAKAILDFMVICISVAINCAYNTLFGV